MGRLGCLGCQAAWVSAKQDTGVDVAQARTLLGKYVPRYLFRLPGTYRTHEVALRGGNGNGNGSKQPPPKSRLPLRRQHSRGFLPPTSTSLPPTIAFRIRCRRTAPTALRYAPESQPRPRWVLATRSWSSKRASSGSVESATSPQTTHTGPPYVQLALVTSPQAFVTDRPS